MWQLTKEDGHTGRVLATKTYETDDNLLPFYGGLEVYPYVDQKVLDPDHRLINVWDTTPVYNQEPKYVFKLTRQ